MTGELPSLGRAALEPGRALNGRAPISQGRLGDDLAALGVRSGQDLLVHSSLREVGWIDGGVDTLLRAIRQVIGPAATIVVPTFTPLTSPSSRAFRNETAGLDQEAYARRVAEIIPFDPETTPSYQVGWFAEHVRKHPEARRSVHPQTSFAALGPGAQACTAGHDADCHLGERSPLRWLYDADAAILLLGVGYAECSAFHLAEYRLHGGASVRGADLDDSDFALLGAELERDWGKHPAGPRSGFAAMARTTLVPVRTAVNFAVEWMERNRSETAL